MTEFSVSMCVYGRDNPDWFRTAVDSILNQTVPPSEVVVVVDGPVPEELDAVIRGYEMMPVFKVIRLAENRGHGEARRTGLEHCSNDIVALMDADDISLPYRFEKQLAVFAENPDLSVLSGKIAEFVDEETNVVGYRSVPERHDEIYAYLKRRCPLNQVAVMFRKEDVREVGGYLDWYCNEDYYLWIRLRMAGKKFANLSDVLVNVRVGRDMYMRRGGWKYFRSEARLQRYMLKSRVIGLPTYLMNVSKRLAVQILMPSRLRGWVFQKFARENK